jgi:predicted dehydrogenase
MHLPNLAGMAGTYAIQAVASRTGPNANATAAQYGAAYATTDPAQVLADPNVDLVVIATRHDNHADLAMAALRAGKHVLVEKPLAMTPDQLDLIEEHFSSVGEAASPVLLTGFNRRFSPSAVRLAELLRSRAAPMVMTYRMNAGYLPLDHWTQGDEGGGRNVGEACHIYDLFTFLTSSRSAAIQAQAIQVDAPPYSPRDNFVATIRFEDGSVGTLTYTALGAVEYPKEQLEVFSDGRVLALDDYRRLNVSGSKAAGLTSTAQEKGQKEELAALAKAIRDGGPWPIPLWQQLQAMRIAFAVEPALTGVA